MNLVRVQWHKQRGSMMNPEQKEAIRRAEISSLMYHQKQLSEYEDIKRIARMFYESRRSQKSSKMAFETS